MNEAKRGIVEKERLDQAAAPAAIAVEALKFRSLSKMLPEIQLPGLMKPHEKRNRMKKLGIAGFFVAGTALYGNYLLYNGDINLLIGFNATLGVAVLYFAIRYLINSKNQAKLKEEISKDAESDAALNAVVKARDRKWWQQFLKVAFCMGVQNAVRLSMQDTIQNDLASQFFSAPGAQLVAILVNRYISKILGWSFHHFFNDSEHLPERDIKEANVLQNASKEIFVGGAAFGMGYAMISFTPLAEMTGYGGIAAVAAVTVASILVSELLVLLAKYTLAQYNVGEGAEKSFAQERRDIFRSFKTDVADILMFEVSEIMAVMFPSSLYPVDVARCVAIASRSLSGAAWEIRTFSDTYVSIANKVQNKFQVQLDERIGLDGKIDHDWRKV